MVVAKERRGRAAVDGDDTGGTAAQSGSNNHTRAIANRWPAIKSAKQISNRSRLGLTADRKPGPQVRESEDPRPKTSAAQSTVTTSHAPRS